MSIDSNQDAPNRELSGSVIGAAMKVHRTLKPGLDEKLYENALVIELTKLGHRVDQQKSFEVRYDGQLIGQLIPDLVVDSELIVDTKVVVAFNDAHFAQMLGYLNITGFEIGAAAELQTCKFTDETSEQSAG